MVKQNHEMVIIILCSTLSAVATAVTKTTDVMSATEQKNTSGVTSETQRLARSRCTSCSVNGQLYDGHSRFHFDEGCSRYRCVCRCDGSWECPRKYVINLCGQNALTQGQRQVGPSSSSSSRSSQPSSLSHYSARCISCVINGKEYQGHSRFTYTQGCVSIDNCACYCNGSWACPQDITASACNNNNTRASRDISTTDRTVQPERDHSSNDLRSSNYSNTIISEGHDNSATKADLKLLHGECRNCTAGGKTIKGNNYFELIEGCRKLPYCTCYCNGTWSCPEQFMENICEADNIARSRDQPADCKSCNVKNNTFPGNQYFQVTDGCVEYRNCICYCNGEWICPEEQSINKCAGKDGRSLNALSSSRCKQCAVQGQLFPGNQYFQFVDRCIEYRHCICRCDGSWSCPQDSAREVCLDNDSQAATTASCTGCNVYGSFFSGNNYFQFKRGCLEYSNCVCFCNGSWSCPADSTRNICNRETSPYLGLSEDGVMNTSLARCSHCLAYGKYFKGGDYFDVTDGCISYRKCICRCDGSWDCNSRFAVNNCRHQTMAINHVRDLTTNNTSSGLDSKQTDNQCSFCDAREKVVTGNTYFDLTNGCFEYKNCLCRCDGSWECPSYFAKNICSANNQTTSFRSSSLLSCSNCVAQGKIIEGNSNFQLINGCILYPSCLCHCNGTWNCSEQQMENICIKNITAGAENCSMCQSNDGVLHPPNTRFKLTEECIEHRCLCFCNGSWSCPAHENRWVCQDRCLKCDVGGNVIENNSQFVHRSGCLEYTCNCHCNGTWSCEDHTVRDTCRSLNRDSCSRCNVSATEVYDGESDFVLEQGCIHYNCRCNCDGSYLCPGKKARNVCRGELLGGCKSCVVSETEIFRGGDSFVLRKGCIFYDCKCNCDGSWSCTSEKARNVCLGEVPGGCRVCRLSESQSYRPGFIFDMRHGCMSYKCKCSCDGGWFCPGKDARDVCKGEVPGGCRSCIFSEQEYFPAGTNFEIVRDCVRYQCRCNCDGSYNCPGDTAKRICGNTTAKKICKSCRVSATEEFEGNTRFYLQRNCSHYECVCNCDGSWECPPENTRSTCPDNRRHATSYTSCRSCRISKYVFPSISSFKFNSGCFQFDCLCECSGRWSCDSRNPQNICREMEQMVRERPLISDTNSMRKADNVSASSSLHIAAQTPLSGATFNEPDIHVQNIMSSRAKAADSANSTVSSDSNESSNVRTRNCKPCHADGKTFTIEDMFSIDRGCVEYKNCRCYCNGRWNCADVLDKCQTSTISPDQSEKQSFDVTKWLETKKTTSASRNKDGDDEAPITSEDKDTFVADQGVVNTHDPWLADVKTNFLERRLREGSREQQSKSDTCQECDVSGVIYPAGSKFILYEKCYERSCECHCNRSWSCDNTVNICEARANNTAGQGQCNDCRVGSDVYISENDFQINHDCLQYNCHCFCNGTHSCPTDLIRNKCLTNIVPSTTEYQNEEKHNEGQIRMVHLTTENGDVLMPSKVPGCKVCRVKGQTIQSLSTFVKHLGCYESLCFCQCNGQPSCSPSAFVNVCKMDSKKSGNERKGCQVGQRTHFTRVFAHVENCILRACVCQDDGQWFCKRSINDMKVC